MSIEAIGAPAPEAAGAVDLRPDTSKPIGLHSPPDSNNAMDVDDSDSELSDLDEVADKLNGALKDEPVDEAAQESQPPADDDIGEILPDHWSGNVPVFKPTMKQFRDFKLFVRWLSLSLSSLSLFFFFSLSTSPKLQPPPPLTEGM